MGTISKDARKITLFYHSGTSLGKKTYPYVTTAKRSVLAIDIAKTKVTGTQWTELAEGLGIGIADLVHRKHPDFIKEYGSPDVDLESEGWLNILRNKPHLLICPIIIVGTAFFKVHSPTDFIRIMEEQNIENKEIGS
ncbi:hypothetical protein EHW67_09810 [Arenibacter aquaticus]|uniref:Arsenate reductase n=1 Tax=Arenibacter aquaticus TaxID=2489054 RepID=A0A3S0CN17_9FLAO|nr:hypothetical protein [Arenibacter aquaticus]RTE53317.1 hypothetical protein EHW67_09810 [Arenibacter aquaticus]